MTQVHFNDVYNVESRGVEPVGGAARFLTAVRSATSDTQPLILFSGDIFAPSISKLVSCEQKSPKISQSRRRPLPGPSHGRNR